MFDLIRLSEPLLVFRYDQMMEDPRDGLTLFGPLDAGKPYGIRAGVIGTPDGIRRFKQWVQRIQTPTSTETPDIARPIFPGFEAVFRIPWNPRPAIEIQIPKAELADVVRYDDRHQRVFYTVGAYADRIIQAIRDEDVGVDTWFVIVPDDVYKYCRPRSYVPSSVTVTAPNHMKIRTAQMLLTQPSLFEEDNLGAVPYYYDVNFHNQLKARLLKYQAPTQVIRESTIAHRQVLNDYGKPLRDLDGQESAIAWNLTTTAFYKAGGRPWKIGGIREGVCYVGMVFKRVQTSPDPNWSCCAAQMFLDSGDGVVFRGAVGPWYSPITEEYHLSRQSATELVSLVLNAYEKLHGRPPRELFLHGRARFSDEEWGGFRDAITGTATQLVGVRIRDETDFKLYRLGDHPVLRGLAYIRDERTAYLWTKGYVPRLRTYPGREVPRPVLIDVCRGEAAMSTVLSDILALTKLDYNACIFADGYPVTLVFADAVGKILTAGPIEDIPPLSFKHYI